MTNRPTYDRHYRDAAVLAFALMFVWVGALLYATDWDIAASVLVFIGICAVGYELAKPCRPVRPPWFKSSSGPMVVTGTPEVEFIPTIGGYPGGPPKGTGIRRPTSAGEPPAAPRPLRGERP